MDTDEEVTPLTVAHHQIRLLERQVRELREQLARAEKEREHLTTGIRRVLERMGAGRGA